MIIVNSILESTTVSSITSNQTTIIRMRLGSRKKLYHKYQCWKLAAFYINLIVFQC